MQTRRTTAVTNGKQRKSNRGKFINLNVRMSIASPATFVLQKFVVDKGCHMLYATITQDLVVSPYNFSWRKFTRIYACYFFFFIIS